MKILSLIFLIALFYSCEGSRKAKDTDSKEKDYLEQAQKNIISKAFPEKDRLFLNFYAGMSYSDYAIALTKSIESNNLFYYERPNDISFGTITEESDILVKDTILDPGEIMYWQNSIVFPLVVDGSKYFTQLEPLRDNSSFIIGVGIYGPMINPLDTNDYSNKDIKQVLANYKNQVLKLYTRKYGKPTVKSRIVNEPKDLIDLIINEFDDKNEYIFQNNQVTAVFRQYSKYSYSVEYLLTSDYLQKINQQKEQKKIIKESFKEQEKKTHSNI
jgi:hypothetical protein